MKIIKLDKKKKNICKGLLFVNTMILLALAIYFVYFKVIEDTTSDFFYSYVFLPLLLMFLGFETMLMPLIANNSSYKSNTNQDEAIFTVGIILEVIAFATIFLLIFLNGLAS